MSGATPWSVKGIEPKTREVAKDLARRSGMTLGEWLSEMIEETGDDDGYSPMSHRAALRETPEPAYDRRVRGSRRMDDAYGRGASALDVVEALSARIEAAERRSAIAIEGVDTVVTGLVRQIQSLQDDNVVRERRIDSIGEELREGRTRLRQVETDLGPKNGEALAKLEQAIGKLAGQFYEAETRGRDAGVILRERMDRFERDHSAERVVDSAAARVAARLEEAQSRTAQSLAKLELSFADLDRRLVESRRGGVDTGALERLAESFGHKLETARSELLRRMETAASSDPRVDQLDRAMTDLSKHVRASESRSVEALETMGREVLRIAENLNGRVTDAETAQAEQQQRALKAVEDMGKDLSRTLSGDITRVAESIDQRLRRADDQHAMALERLGTEIARISERLSERIGQGERRAAQGVEDLAEKLVRASEKMESRYDRASGELAERMRQSEERTAALLSEARDSIERQQSRKAAFEPDWREPAFPAARDFSDDWGATPAATDPGFPADPVFVDEPAMEAAEDVFVAEPAFEPEPVFVEPVFAEPAVEQHAAFEEPVFSPPATEEAAPPAFGATAPAAVAADAALDDIIDDEVVIEPMPAFEPAAAAPLASEAPIYQSGEQPDLDAFDADAPFVDARPAGAPQRPVSTREALAAARAAAGGVSSDATPDDEPRRKGFGFSLGGKSRLQKRLDKQAKGDSTVRKALIATTTAVVLVGAGTFGALNYQRVVAEGSAIPTPEGGDDSLMAAAAIAPTGPQLTPLAPEAEARGRALFEQASGLMESGDAEGVRLMSQAANIGYPQAQFAMARLYETGEGGVTADEVEARRWTERAARGGEPRAMHNLALYLFEGTGGAVDRAGSIDWFRAAAQRGVVDSQYNLGRLYEQGGEGIASDPVLAYQWYLVASRAGDAEAQVAAQRIEADLTTAQRSQGQGQAEAFRVEAMPVQG